MCRWLTTTRRWRRSSAGRPRARSPCRPRSGPVALVDLPPVAPARRRRRLHLHRDGPQRRRQQPPVPAPSNALTVGVPPAARRSTSVGRRGRAVRVLVHRHRPARADPGRQPRNALPDGLTFDPTTATISGTPTSASSTFVDISATSALGQVQNTFTLVVNPGDLGTVSPTPTTTTSSTPPTTSPTPTHSGTTPPTSSSHGATSAGSSTGLASTGMPVETFVVVAAGLLLLGALLVATTRIRRRS